MFAVFPIPINSPRRSIIYSERNPMCRKWNAGAFILFSSGDYIAVVKTSLHAMIDTLLSYALHAYPVLVALVP